LSNQTFVPNVVEELNKETKLPVVLCLQETSTPLPKDQDNVQTRACNIKIGRHSWEGRGTNKYDSGNQRCNTVIYWSNEIKHESREAVYHGNRYYECVKLSLNRSAFWVLCVHAPSMGPSGYATNGNQLGSIFQKASLEKNPLIAIGDMNSQPGDMDAGKGLVVKSGKPTRIKAGSELDFMVVFGAKAASFHQTNDAGNNSDHLAVSFIVELEVSSGFFGFDKNEKTGNPYM
jgi:endonuclease/exonuclease/phosphatase family metal-dependent hydrolase